MSNQEAKAYLGDGVYAAFDGFCIVLTAENRVSITNTIFLDTFVADALAEYIEKLRATQVAGNTQ